MHHGIISRRLILILTLIFGASGFTLLFASSTLAPGFKADALLSTRVSAHPLDPLSEAEIETAFAVLKEYSEIPGAFFPILVLREPPKQEVLRFTPGSTFRREVYAEVFDWPNNRLYKAVVDLRQQQVVSWQSLPVGVQPAVMFDEYEILPDIVRANPQWQAAMVRRGITDFESVYLNGWVGGELSIPGVPEGTRLMRVLSFLHRGLPNPYLRPIEGVTVAVDLNQMQVVHVIDTVVAPVSTDPGTSDPGVPQEPLKPLHVRQPEGPSFEVQGHEIRWQGWNFRYALHPRDGLVLYTVGYADQGRIRPVLYRAALSEIVVPYAQPDENWAWRFARDIGEYGCGRNANALVPGVDVPPNATFLDAVLADDVGQTIDYPSTVALYERHGTLLWKRVDPESGEQDARLARELVIAADCGIGNYVYGLRWIFHQDGTLEAQVDLTGTLLLQGVASPEEGERHGTAVADHIIAPSHQHFFSFRLDFDVDGSTNRVSEVNTHPLPIGPENPYGNAFAATTQLLPSELEAQRDLNFQTDRTWKVTNPSVLNTLGHPVGYTLQPGDSTRPYISPQYPGRQHTGFIEHQLWVTAYDPNQMYAAGPYPNQSQRDEGLPQWIVDDANIVDTDIVLWHTIGATHHPEVEEYPVMPVQHIGFRLTPDGFFGKNPALNRPPRP